MCLQKGSRNPTNIKSKTIIVQTSFVFIDQMIVVTWKVKTCSQSQVQAKKALKTKSCRSVYLMYKEQALLTWKHQFIHFSSSLELWDYFKLKSTVGWFIGWQLMDGAGLRSNTERRPEIQGLHACDLWPLLQWDDHINGSFSQGQFDLWEQEKHHWNSDSYWLTWAETKALELNTHPRL